MLSELKAIGATSIKAKALAAIWTFPSIIFSALVIGWAAEAAQFLFSQGLALAILAWLQTLPEFAVEAVIAWEAGIDPEKVHLVTANFTGSLRLLTGLAWPMIYFTAAFFRKKKQTGKRLVSIHLEGEHAVEVMGLLPPISYFFIILLKGTLSLFDSVILVIMYLGYLFVLQKIPPQDQEKVEDVDKVPRMILQMKPFPRNASITALFLIGGFWLYFVAHPFLYSMLALATLLGVSNFVFVQWVAPFLSEFPEKVTAFNWARKVKKAPMALMNMVSSNINQWTVLVAMIPIVYSISRGEVSVIHFDHHQKVEGLKGLLVLLRVCVRSQGVASLDDHSPDSVLPRREDLLGQGVRREHAPDLGDAGDARLPFLSRGLQQAARHECLRKHESARNADVPRYCQ